jgi:DNA invertase Pin-like site-specific DNA recombinase
MAPHFASETSNPAARLSVAEYVRMSTDHQKYSTANQAAAIREYADKHDMDVVRTYGDDGKSGLEIGRRAGLRRLLDDVTTGHLDFSAILVYDISRWGRFQNSDEAAHYEYLCTKAGVRVIYCAEPFENDGTPLSTIVKGVKRSMAAEYSRELSAKVFAGQCRLVKLGFHQGGSPGYGLRRQLIDEHRSVKGLLFRGQQKSIQTDRVVLVAGPDDEVAVVHRIYHLFLERHLGEQSIADLLNDEHILTDLERPWSRGTVHQVLTNEKYIGNNVYARTSGKLKTPTLPNPPERWVRCDGAFDGIVSPAAFLRVREIIAERSVRLEDHQMLVLLRELASKVQALSGLVIDEQPDMPSSTSYRQRFGGLVRAYALIGYDSGRDFGFLEVNRQLRAWRPSVVSSVVDMLAKTARAVERNPETDLLTVNGEWTASVVLAKCHRQDSGSLRWKVRFDMDLMPDITVAVRLDELNKEARDYYLVPRLDMATWPRHLGFENSPFIDGYRFDTLDILAELAARTHLREAA